MEYIKNRINSLHSIIKIIDEIHDINHFIPKIEIQHCKVFCFYYPTITSKILLPCFFLYFTISFDNQQLICSQLYIYTARTKIRLRCFEENDSTKAENESYMSFQN